MWSNWEGLRCRKCVICVQAPHKPNSTSMKTKFAQSASMASNSIKKSQSSNVGIFSTKIAFSSGFRSKKFAQIAKKGSKSVTMKMSSKFDWKRVFLKLFFLFCTFEVLFFWNFEKKLLFHISKIPKIPKCKNLTILQPHPHLTLHFKFISKT